MSQQIQISGGAKVRDLQDVIIGTSGVLSSLAFNVANGVPKLDVNGKILVSQLPNSVMEYKGVWNAATNTPTLANGTGNQGDVYLCNVAGTTNFGAGPIAFVVGDQVIYSSVAEGSIWQRASGATGTVTSVALTESGDSLNITGSPITTSGTINIGFNGTNLQYVNGAGNLTTFPILTGYVPYTGATQDVDLNTFKLNAQSIHAKGTGGLGHFGMKHQSASATASANEVSLFADSLGDFSWLNGNLYLSKFITSGNTAARSYTFPNANGTVALTSDLANYVDLTTAQTIGGTKTFSDATKNNGGIFLQNASSNSLAGYMNIGGLTNGVKFTSGGGISNTFTLPSATGYTFTFPNATGTIALTSDLTGGTVTSVAALTIGTSGTDLSSSVANSTTTPVITLNVPTASATNRGALSSADWTTFNNKQNALTNPVLASGTWTSGYLPKINGTYTIGNSNVTDTGSLITLGSNTNISSGALGIGTTSLTGYTLRLDKNITGSANPTGFLAGGTIQTDATGAVVLIGTSLQTVASANSSNVYHYNTGLGSIGAGTVIGNLYGYVASGLTQGTSNFGFYGNIASGTNRWNLYMNGTANNYLAGALGIGATGLTGYNLRVSRNITGNLDTYGIMSDGQIQSDVTTSTDYFRTNASTQAAAFTLFLLNHYNAGQGTFGASSSVTSQCGFSVSANMIGATNNFGFRGQIPAGTNRWNLFMDGTANNYMAGSLGIGTTSITAYNLRASKAITGAVTGHGIALDTQIQSDVTTQVWGFMSKLSTAAAAFNVAGGIRHFFVNGFSLGAGSSIGNQFGFYASLGTAGSTNYGFYGDGAAASNVWNLYMAGTANNYLAGHLGIGTTSLDANVFRVLKNLTSTITTAVNIGGQIQSDGVGQNNYINTSSSTAAATFTVGAIRHINLQQGTFGAGSTVTDQFGVFVGASMIGAAFNFGFFGDIPAGTNRWNLYMSGTAANYMAGVLNIGTTTLSGYRLDVNGTARVQNKLSVGTPSAASAIMEITSTTQGFLPPRMTSAQRIAIGTPATGLIVYQTDGVEGLWLNTSTGWRELTVV